MIDSLHALDQQLYTLITNLPHDDTSVGLALMLTGIGAGWFLWFVLRNPKIFFPISIAAGVSWILTEIILKPVFARPRPTIYEGFSFPSSHAAVAFTVATLLSHLVPRWKLSLYSLAILIALSRVYIGVHYPSDVIIGAGLGWIIGIKARKVPQGKSYKSRKR